MIYRVPSQIAFWIMLFVAVVCFVTGMIGMGIFLLLGAVACLAGMRKNA